METTTLVAIFISGLLVSFTGYALYTAFGQPSQQLRDPFEEHGDYRGIQVSTSKETCLKLPIGAPLTVEEQIMTIYTGTNGYLDSLEIGQVRKFLVELRTYLKTNKPQFQEIISSTKTFIEEAEALLKEAIQEQMDRFLLQEQA
ncbi:hypothetical protein BUALT_Bualt09G0011900 [Buddleja alternifolia]|uniref:ATP synthase alpha subunit C-terminal domain-containing protein n=2 Tax=Magnoliopsida TaxID=3398 RepID=A0AAV6X7L0_9LAMI|nr:hypothetical protein BUALT_Bualt09G0011900 [Buddleja alternifolia]